MQASSPNILIIGAGPTGLAAAWEFAKHDVHVDIMEKRSGPSYDSRAVGVMPETLLKLVASIPIALCEARDAGKVNSGDLVCLAAFGSGFTWGSALIRW